MLGYLAFQVPISNPAYEAAVSYLRTCAHNAVLATMSCAFQRTASKPGDPKSSNPEGARKAVVNIPLGSRKALLRNRRKEGAESLGNMMMHSLHQTADAVCNMHASLVQKRGAPLISDRCTLALR